MSMEQKIKYVSSILQSKTDMTLFKQDKPCIGLLRRGKITAIPADKCHLAACDDDTLLITPHPQNAAYIHMVTKKPVWLYDKVEDIRGVYKSAKDLSEFVIFVCRPQDEQKGKEILGEWVQIKDAIGFAPLTPEEEMTRFNQNFRPAGSQ